VTNDVFAVVGGTKAGFLAGPGRRLTTDETLLVGFLTVLTNDLSFWPPVDPAFKAEITLRTEDGKAMAKTKLGKSFGTRFGKLVNLWDSRMGSGYADSIYNSNVAQGLIPAASFPGVGECFKVSKPGKYYLTIRLQGFRRPASGPGDVRFVRFPPFEVPVYKEDLAVEPVVIPPRSWLGVFAVAALVVSLLWLRRSRRAQRRSDLRTDSPGTGKGSRKGVKL
jgi:hypothetical protein